MSIIVSLTISSVRKIKYKIPLLKLKPKKKLNNGAIPPRGCYQCFTMEVVGRQWNTKSDEVGRATCGGEMLGGRRRARRPAQPFHRPPAAPRPTASYPSKSTFLNTLRNQSMLFPRIETRASGLAPLSS